MGRVQITSIEASGILSPQKKDGFTGFDFTMNPYVGCAFGCTYCYVREMQYGDDAADKAVSWGDWVKVKANAVALLQRSGRKLYGRGVLIGSATDPYQPIERRTGLTRALLETLVMAYPSRVSIITRSPLVTRDLDVFARFGESLNVCVSIPTDDDAVRKVFEPSAPSIPQRLEALGALREAGVRTMAFVAPLLPFDPQRLGELLRPLADDLMVSSMRYHDTDEAMKARYRLFGWGRSEIRDSSSVKERLRAAWSGGALPSLRAEYPLIEAGDSPVEADHPPAGVLVRA